jgi:hypothetical protein
MILSQLSLQLDVDMLSSMNTSKPASIVFSVILIVLLVGACGTIPPEQGSNETATNTRTLTPVPPTTTQTPTPEFVTVPATVMPTQPPPPILTPDTIQVERWKEYQTELAKVLFAFDPKREEYDPERYKDALCEWDILEQSGQEIYVWAECISADGLALRSNPAVIYRELDESIREVEVVRAEADPRTQFAVYDLQLFPMSIQETLCLYYFFGTVPQCSSITSNYVPNIGPSARERVLVSHLEYRLTYPGEPPLIVLSAVLTATPTP